MLSSEGLQGEGTKPKFIFLGTGEQREMYRENPAIGLGPKRERFCSSRAAGMISVCPAVLKARGAILLEDTVRLTAFGLRFRSTE